MANNFVSYNRFTALPPNIGSFGVTVEELEIQRGKPDPNPVLSPMAAPRASEVMLALTPAGSDLLRMGNLIQPEVNPYEGAKSNLSLSRNAFRKLGGAIIGHLGHMIGGSSIEANLKGLMQDSLRRVIGMREYLGHRVKLTESIYVRSIAASKG